MLRLENVTYRYRDNGEPVLRNLNLEVRAGERLGVMGANGSGKSTLALIIAGLVQPQRGRVHLHVDNTTLIPVGILFQNPDNQMVAVTVEKEIAFVLENLGVTPDEMELRITATLERFSIEHLRQRLTSELSGGEKQRVALAATMVSCPPVLVLDEPDSFLDEPGKRMLTEELARLHRQDPAMIQIHITQYRSTANRYGRLIVLERGSIRADGAPEEILSNRELCNQTGLSYQAKPGRHLAMPDSTEDASPDASRLKEIRMNRVSFEYAEGHEILRNVSLDLKRGECLGLVGPSGCGKTTLGLLLGGLTAPVSGSVEYLDETDNRIDAKNLVGNVSIVFQQPERQFFLSRCDREIAFGPKNLGRVLNPKEIHRFFALVGLDPVTFAPRDPIALSGGEKRRLACAVVLSMLPGFVIFDEPTCGLDQEGVGRFVSLVRSLRAGNVGLVIITHDGGLIHAVCDRVIHLTGDGGWREMNANEFVSPAVAAGIISPPDSVDPEADEWQNLADAT